jgi:apolipoprotein N-acyltransferase
VTPLRLKPIRGSWPFLLAALSGTLYFLGFAGFELWPFSFIALIPLIALIDLGPPMSGGRSLAVGGVFGFVTHAGGYYWLIGMLEDFSGFPLPVCYLFSAIVCLYQGGQLALFFWLMVRAKARGVPAVWSAVPAYAACELVYPLLFPSYFANSLHNIPVLIQIADFGGPILVTGLITLCNAGLYALGYAAIGRVKPTWAVPATAALALGLTVAYGVGRIEQVQARDRAAPKITIGLVQANMGIFAKRADVAEGHTRHIDQSLTLERDAHPDLVIWPESAIQEAIWLERGADQPWVLGPVRTPVLFGGLAVRTVSVQRRVYNTAFITDRQGTIKGSYDKVYLVAFSEYLPFGDTFPILYKWSPNSSRFSKGTSLDPLPLGDYRISTLICYEDIFPAFVRKVVARGNPHLLVNITNDAWFGKTTEPWIHLALAKFRAIEHRRYLARATNSGVSAVIDPVGRVVVHSGVFERANLHVKVSMLTGHTVYEWLGDWFGWVGLFVIVWAGFIRRKAASVPNRRG